MFNKVKINAENVYKVKETRVCRTHSNMKIIDRSTLIWKNQNMWKLRLVVYLATVDSHKEIVLPKLTQWTCKHHKTSPMLRFLIEPPVSDKEAVRTD